MNVSSLDIEVPCQRLVSLFVYNGSETPSHLRSWSFPSLRSPRTRDVPRDHSRSRVESLRRLHSSDWVTLPRIQWKHKMNKCRRFRFLGSPHRKELKPPVLKIRVVRTTLVGGVPVRSSLRPRRRGVVPQEQLQGGSDRHSSSSNDAHDPKAHRGHPKEDGVKDQGPGTCTM